MSLRQRFEAFVQTLEGYESIDLLLGGNAEQGKRRADYLFRGRSIIVEQKTLEENPAQKVDDFMEKLSEERGILVFGKMPVDVILSGQPDGASLNRDLHYRLTNGLDSAFSSADKQVKSTKEIFSIPEAAGILVIINEGASINDPKAVAHKISQMFCKESNGEIRYPHNCLAIIISELHQVKSNIPTNLLPIITINGLNAAKYPQAQQFADDLPRRWAAWNGIPLIDGAGLDPTRLEFTVAKP